MTLEQARKLAARALKDVKPRSGAGVGSTGWTQHGLPTRQFPVPDLVFFGLTQLRGLPHLGPGEKCRWSVSAEVDGSPFSVELAKFGPRVFVEAGCPKHVEEKIFRLLWVATRLAEGHLRDMARSQLDSGNVTVPNRFRTMDSAYRFFREQASRAYRRKPAKAKTKKTAFGTVTTFRPFDAQLKGGYLAAAMLDAYFSRLESLLVTVLPLTTLPVEGGTLATFPDRFWDEKWKAIFAAGSDPEAPGLLRELRGLKETFRNPSSHGGFQKRGASFYFHVKGVGALPMQLSRQGTKSRFTAQILPPFSFSIDVVHEATFKSFCATLDRVDSFMEASSIRNGIRYVKAGLDVPADEAFRKRFHAIATSDAEVEHFIEQMTYQQDQHANMDY